MRRALLLTLALGFAAFACQLVAGIERVDKVPAPIPPPPDAEPDTFVPDPCEHVDVPDIPEKDDGPDASVGPQYLAVRHLTFLPKTDAGGFVGFDLDGVCTCDTRAATADGGASSCVPSPKADVCDDFGGIDNQLSKVLDPYASTVLDIDKAADINAHIDEGRQGLVIYLSSYNGLPNDREVQLGVYLSNGIADSTGCQNDEDLPRDLTIGPRYRPKWCGSDIWSVDPRTTLQPATVPNVIGKGWVKDGVLVAKVDGVSLYLGTLPLTIASMRLRGRLTKVGSSWHLDDGIFAGRAPVRDLLQGAGTLAFGSVDAGRYLCREASWGVIRSNICESADLAESSSFDWQGQPCGALSLAFGFAAEGATIGAVIPADDLPNPCLGDAAPPGSYVCPKTTP